MCLVFISTIAGSGLRKFTETLVSTVGLMVLSVALGAIVLVLLFQFGGESPPVSGAGTAMIVVAAVAPALAVALLLRLELARDRLGSPLEQASLPLSFFDTMTGIPNKLYFQDRIAGVLSAGRDGAIFLIDLADFGRFNDRRGRAFGDAVIKELGHRLRQRAEASGGLAARLGGDRFGLFLPGPVNGRLEGVSAEVMTLCAEPVTKGGEVVDPQVSIGAVSIGDLGELRAHGFDSVMSVCNFALSTAKASGRGTFRVYDKALEQQFIDLDAMAVALPRALRSGELEVFLQPRVNLSNRSYSGFEALVRWTWGDDHVPAEQLISMAEETGLIFDLDHYMIDRAVQVMADWNRRRKTAFPVSVNLSALHLERETGVEFILDCLQRHRLAPELLTIEITETTNLSKWQHFEGLSGLREAGCRISIDDFGTGYSSLARLRSLPADEIKIDRVLASELTDNKEARFVLEAVLVLASNLDMEVVIEGIEDEDQLAILIDLGCHQGQGFLFGKPRPALDWLADATYGPSDEAPAA